MEDIANTWRVYRTIVVAMPYRSTRRILICIQKKGSELDMGYEGTTKELIGEMLMCQENWNVVEHIVG